MKTNHFSYIVRIALAAVVVLTTAVASAKTVKRVRKARPSTDNHIPAIAKVSAPVVKAAAQAAKTSHPRLFGSAADFNRIKTSRDSLVRMGRTHVIACANELLTAPPCQYQKEGKRLLGVCRTALYRINTLAMAWRLGGNRAPSNAPSKKCAPYARSPIGTPPTSSTPPKCL